MPAPTTQADRNIRANVNILIIKPSSLGDIVHTLPAVQLLRRHCPDASISWVVNEAYAELLDLCPDIDEVIPFRRQRWAKPRHWGEVITFIKDLRERRFDLVVDFQGLLRSSLMALLSNAPRRVGFRSAREGASLFYTEKVLLPANVSHAVDKNLFLARTLIGEAAKAEPVVLKPDHDARKRAKVLLNRPELSKPFVLAVAPAARWQSKAWPPEFFAAVLDAAAERIPTPWGCWLLGTHEERRNGEELIGKCRLAAPVNLMGEANLTTLVELLRASDALLTNDSGPMHLAAVVGVPVFALFGPTDPGLTGPYGEQHLVFRTSCEKAPCLSRECPKPENLCFQSIDADEVAGAIAGLCNQRQAARSKAGKKPGASGATPASS